ncbi:phthiocerol/phthiodiolone dimycocerosyl transferase family protein [Nocardia niigatensis]
MPALPDIVRPLAPSETIYARSEVYVAYVVRAVGELDLESLRAAFTAVVGCHPILGAHLRRIDGEYRIVSGAATPPRLVVCETEAEFHSGASELRQHETLAALFVIRAGDTAGLALTIHHSIADAHYAFAVLEQLWSSYTDVVAGRPLETVVRSCPESVETLLTNRDIADPTAAERQAAPRAGVAIGIDPSDWESVARQFRTSRIVRHRFTKAETSALTGLCFQERLTLNGLVSGAIVLTEAEVRGIALPEISYIFPVDLHALVTPRIGPFDGTNVLGMSAYTPRPKTPADVVSQGIAVCNQLRSWLAAGVVQRSVFHTVDVTEHGFRQFWKSHPGLVASTNFGRLPDLRSPETLCPNDFGTVMFEHPEVEADSGGGPDDACTYVISIFDRRLSIEVHHHQDHGAQRQHQRIELVVRHLQAVLAERGSTTTVGGER